MKQLGVVIPTRNSCAWLPQHLDAVESWMALADEIVVVDSESTDGTLELLKRRLVGERVRFLQHPPGLYASWNHGVAQLGTRWTYIATVGDTIDRAGISALLAAGEQLECDVVCSPPRWVWPDGSSTNDSTPVGEMAVELGLSEPARLTPAVLVAYCAVYALGRGLNTPLCSSASDLYRTETLKQHPFPVKYGSAGDAFWLLENAVFVRYGLMPGSLATFLAHPAQHLPINETLMGSRFEEAARISRANVEALRRRNFISTEEAQLLEGVVEAFARQCATEMELDAIRDGQWGRLWPVRPRAWGVRRERDRRRQEGVAAHRSFIRHVLDNGRAVVNCE